MNLGDISYRRMEMMAMPGEGAHSCSPGHLQWPVNGAGRVQSTSEHMGQAESLYIPKRPDSPLFLEIPGELEYKQAKPMSHNVNYPHYSAISINTHTQKVLQLQINV